MIRNEEWRKNKQKYYHEKYRKILRYCTDKKIFFQPSEIHGLEKGFYHFGDMGVRLKNNIKQSWFRTFVNSRDDIYSFEGTMLSLADIWKGSGHKFHFDFIIGCQEGEELHWYSVDRLNLQEDEIDEILNIETSEKFKQYIRMKKLKCPICGEVLRDFRVMSTIFKLKMEREDFKSCGSFLRPETCQDIFLNFKKIGGRKLRLPFGIAQIGKVFRNEATQRRRIFRCREFELMELEYFVDPKDKEVNLFEYEKFEAYAKSAEMDHEKMIRVEYLVELGIIKCKWLAYWIVESIKWLERIGIDKKNLRIRQQTEEERSHYSADTWDVEYRFDWGWDEIEGIAYRKDYDMRSHDKYYRKRHHEKRSNLICDLGGHDFPHVVEISFGVERTLLALLYDSYTEKKGNPVLKFTPQIAPYTVVVFPHRNEKNLVEAALKIYGSLKEKFTTKYHGKNERLGLKYHRFDRLGVPFCISVGNEIKKGKVSISDRYFGETELVRIEEVDVYIWKRIYSSDRAQQRRLEE